MDLGHAGARLTRESALQNVDAPDMLVWPTGDIVKSTRDLDIVSIVIAHINGDHEVSGAKTLEHMVEVPMHLSVVSDTERMMTVKKNRHGPAPAKGTLQMGAPGF